MTLWFYDGAFAKPHEAAPFEDSDEEWHDALGEVRVCDEAHKTSSPAVCGAEFAAGSKTKAQTPDNLLSVHALVLDVDDWSAREPFTEEELREILAGFRFVAWTTWSSTPERLKWRVVMPLETPMPPTKFLSLWRKLNEVLENTMAEASVSDPGRLGFFGTVRSETAKENYSYFIAPGERLDWTLFDLDEEELGLRRALTPADLTRSPDWSTDDEALRGAKRYYGRVGSDVEQGGRHEMLLRASCRLWWDFAAPHEDWVHEVLTVINNNFPEPKDDSEVWKEVVAGQERTLGENRIEQPTMYGAEREPVARATKLAISEMAKTLKRQSSEEKRAKGRALEAIGKGFAYAEPVEARALAFASATELAQSFARESPDRLLDLMRPSLQAQRAKSSVHPVPTDAELLSKIRWKQNEVRRRIDDREKDKADSQRQRILTAFGGQRDTPYTSREYKEWEAEGHADNLWILQKDREYWFFINGEYMGPVAEKTASTFATTYLAPAHEHLELSFIDDKGKVKERPLDALVKDYGTYVTNIEHCLYTTKSAFLPETHTLVVAPLKPRPLEAAFVPEVDKWLRAFAGPQYADLELWLAACGSFDRELSALLLVTEPNQGKKLLVDGLVRIWQQAGVKSLEKATPLSWQLCPVLLCDERVPFYWRQDVAARIREALSETNRDLKPGVSLKGYLRLVFMGNSAGMLWRQVEALTKTEREATRQRMLTIDSRGSREAEYVLQKMGSSHRHFVSQDLIAKHILWLQDTVSIPADRFVINDVLSARPQAALSADHRGNEVVDEIGLWLYRVFADKRTPGSAFWGYDNDVLVHVNEFLKAWPSYSADKREMDKHKLSLFLSAFCSEQSDRYVITAKGQQQRVRLRQFRLDAYEEWLAEQGLDVEDVVDGLLDVVSRKRVRSKG